MAAHHHSLFDFAELARAAAATGHLPLQPAPAPAGASPAIAAACADYFKARSMGESADASDVVTNLACDEMDAAARRLSAIPCRSLPDLAAKALLVLHAREEDGDLTEAESEVLASVAADALAMAGGVA